MTSAASDEPKCRCGLPFVRAYNPEYHLCPNCDRLQAVELQVVDFEDGARVYGTRVKTDWDRRYEENTLHMQKSKWYPEQFMGGVA